MSSAEQVELARIQAVLHETQRRVEDLPHDALTRDEGEIAALLDDLPDPSVDPRVTINHALSTISACLWQIHRMVYEDEQVAAELALLTLMRPVLLSGSRIIYMLGPDSHAVRVQHTLEVLRHETASLMRLYDATESFTELHELVPPPEVLKDQRARAKQVLGDRPPSESTLLDHVSRFVGELIVQQSEESVIRSLGDPVQTQTEIVRWAFNVLSGVSHGWGWTRLVPTADLVAELSTVVSIAHIAVALVDQRAGGGLQAPES